jgi:hypothetical protein
MTSYSFALRLIRILTRSFLLTQKGEYGKAIARCRCNEWVIETCYKELIKKDRSKDHAEKTKT